MSRVHGEPTREEIDRRLREYAGDDANKIVAYIRSVVLSDEDAAYVLHKLDREKLRAERAERMRVSASGTIGDGDER